jgi:predicted nuclease of restriction endonuclease-like (RecB) superfamily
VRETVAHGWSRAVLMNQIDSQLYERHGRAVSNFSQTLPEPQSACAQELTRDPYQFDFLAIRESYGERELKEALLKSITDFLMELGSGFAYMGKVCRLVVGQTEQWLDATPVFHGIADNLNARGGQFCPGFHGTRVMCQEKRPP